MHSDKKLLNSSRLDSGIIEVNSSDNLIQNRFKIIKYLGQGTYGKVNYCHDKYLEIYVAVKTIKPTKVPSSSQEINDSSASNPNSKEPVTASTARSLFSQLKSAENERLEAERKKKQQAIINEQLRIKREIEISQMLYHSNIIYVFDVFQLDFNNEIIISMEYAQHGELYDLLLKNGALNEYHCKSIFKQLCLAVNHCHKLNVVHRDIKLENILLSKIPDSASATSTQIRQMSQMNPCLTTKSNNNYQIKLADFGFARKVKHINTDLLNTFCGSILYASPEVITSKPYIGPKIDNWAMGVILYSLIYGAMPFEHKSKKTLVSQITTGQFYRHKNRKSGEVLIEKLLEVNSNLRYSCEDCLNHYWLQEQPEILQPITRPLSPPPKIFTDSLGTVNNDHVFNSQPFTGFNGYVSNSVSSNDSGVKNNTNSSIEYDVSVSSSRRNSNSSSTHGSPIKSPISDIISSPISKSPLGKEVSKSLNGSSSLTTPKISQQKRKYSEEQVVTTATATSSRRLFEEFQQVYDFKHLNSTGTSPISSLNSSPTSGSPTNLAALDHQTNHEFQSNPRDSHLESHSGVRHSIISNFTASRSSPKSVTSSNINYHNSSSKNSISPETAKKLSNLQSVASTFQTLQQKVLFPEIIFNTPTPNSPTTHKKKRSKSCYDSSSAGASSNHSSSTSKSSSMKRKKSIVESQLDELTEIMCDLNLSVDGVLNKALKIEKSLDDMYK